MQFFTATAVALSAFLAYRWFARTPRSILTDVAGLNRSYDYIIVGGGTAGSVLAARLSENSKWSILLIEAGEAPPAWSHIPGYEVSVQNSAFAWPHKTVPQQHGCFSLKENRSSWPRGKCLGGSSVLNWMHYHRGHPADYDRWAALGNDGWSYEDVLPYFKKLETCTVDGLKTSKFRGAAGPVKVTQVPRTRFAEMFLAAAKEAGHDINADYNDDSRQGFAPCQQTVNDGIRQSTYLTYLKPILDRPNLHIVTRAQATKIKFEDGKAKTVAFVFDGDFSVTHEVSCRHEILLSAGAVGTPQILMLSGIGPADHLKSLQIPVVADLPVGQNLVDHLEVDLTMIMNETIGYDRKTYTTNTGWITALVGYYLFNKDPLNSTLNHLNGVFHSGLTPQDPRPDVQHIIFPVRVFGADIPDNSNFNLEDAIASYSGDNDSFPGTATFITVLLHPRSVGEIRLASANPQDAPLIDPKYLSDPADVEVLLWGLKLLLNVARQDAFKQYGLHFGEQPLPNCAMHLFLSDNYLRCLIRHRTNTVFHDVCTARMGKDPRTSVVDNKLRVHGVSGLRVVDASAFPDQVSGNTFAPVVMFAEKAADEIKKTA